MAGTLTHKGGNLWRARYWVDDPIRGKVRRSVTFAAGGKRLAEVELARLVLEANAGPDARLLIDLCRAFVEAPSARCTPGWRDNQLSLVRLHLTPALGSLTVTKTTSELLERAYATIDRSPQTVRHCHWIVNGALKRELRRGSIDRNPAEHVDLDPLTRREITPPSVADVVALMSRAHEVRDDLPLFLRLLAVTGARRGEVVALTWRHIDWVSSELRLNSAIHESSSAGLLVKGTKTSTSRTVAVDPSTLRQLEAHHSARLAFGLACFDDHFIFGRDGTRIPRPSVYTRAFADLRVICGVEGVRMHDLRHLAASLLFANKMTVGEVSRQLGHARRSTTLDIYEHLIDVEDSRKRAAQHLGSSLDRPPTG